MKIPSAWDAEAKRLDDDDLERQLSIVRLQAEASVIEAIAWFEALVREDEKRKKS